METLSNNLTKYRKAKSLTQEQLGQMVGATRQTIIAIEKGNYVPSLLLAMKIANIFNKRVEEIFKITSK